MESGLTNPPALIGTGAAKGVTSASPSSVAGLLEIPPDPSATALAKRKPVRVTLTMNWQTHQRLLKRSGSEGRSISNLCAHILEVGSE